MCSPGILFTLFAELQLVRVFSPLSEAGSLPFVSLVYSEFAVVPQLRAGGLSPSSGDVAGSTGMLHASFSSLSMR